MRNIIHEAGNPASPFILQYAADISIADVLAEHKRLKHDPAYRAKSLPESALTPAERATLAKQSKREREWLAHATAAWRERSPLGGEVTGYTYDPKWKKGVLTMAPGHKPSMSRVVKFFARWPGCRRIIVKSGAEACITYLATFPGDAGGYEFEGAGWWKAIRPGHVDYVY